MRGQKFICYFPNARIINESIEVIAETDSSRRGMIQADELEKLKKFFNRHPDITEDIVTMAYQYALDNNVAHITLAIKNILQEKYPCSRPST